MAKIIKKEVAMIMCERCGYTWKPRVKNPVKCVNCGHRFKSKPKEELRNEPMQES